MPFIDHFSIGVADLARAGSFYDALLATIGAARRFEKSDFICYGVSSSELFVVNAPNDKAKPIVPSNGFHCVSLPQIRMRSGSFTRSGLPAEQRKTARLVTGHNMHLITMAPS